MRAIKLADKRKLTREEWLAIRRPYVGGSDAGVIANANPWKSRFTLQLEKMGLIPEEDLSEKESVYWGNKLEPIVAEVFSERTGLKIRKLNFVLQDPKYPFMIGNIDYRIANIEEGLEIKTTGLYMEDEWKPNNIPDRVYYQVQHYMAITGWKLWHIAALIGGQKLIIVTVPRDENVIKYLREEEAEFYHNVQNKIIPSPDGSESSAEALMKLYPVSQPPAINLEDNEEIKAMITCHKMLSEELKRIETDKRQAENIIKAALGESEAGITLEHCIGWKTVKPRESFNKESLQKEHPEIYKKYVMAGKPSRRFQIKELKEEEENE